MGIIERKKSILLNTPHIVTASGSIASFNTDMKAPLKECKIHFLPVQSGSGDPSPTNIRPITGWTGVNVEQCAKNLVNVDTSNVLFYSTYNNCIIEDEVVTVTGAVWFGFVVKCSPNTTYTYKITSSVYTNDVMLRVVKCTSKPTSYPSSNWDFLVNRGYVEKRVNTFTTDAETTYLLVGGYVSGGHNGLVISDIQLEKSATDTVYESYTSTQIPVSFGDNGTIYGGYVDLVSGELVAEYAYWYDNGHLTPAITKYTSYNRIVYPGYQLSEMPKNSSTSTLKCNYFKSSSNATPWNAFVGGTGNFLAYIPTSFETAKQWKEYLVDNPLEICYELETPITYQLTPQQLKSLKGINNIWSDANDITEVKFWKH